MPKFILDLVLKYGRPILAGQVRHFLTGGGVYLVTNGYADNDTAQKAIGAAVTLLSLGWSIVQKIMAEKAKQDALVAAAPRAQPAFQVVNKP